MDPSIYASLPLQPGDIRLLRILPDPDKDAPIRCSVFTYTLHNLDDRPHLYEALSYVWGDPNEVVEISVFGQPLDVTKNLHAALRRLRDHYFERIVWIDAVCINQRNKAEVATQILSMANIYGQASRVIVWLGEAADDSDVVLERIRAAASSQQLKEDQEDEALNQLLKRSWFRRVWVLQEVAAAQHIRILCGSKDLDGYAFCAGLQNKGKNGTAHPIVHLIKRATFRSPHVSQKVGRASLSIYPLGHLLDLYNTYESSKPHDRVYALLGLSSDNLENTGLSPDYGVPWDQLLQRLVRHVLGRDIRVDTWKDRDIAMISGQGYIIGQLSDVDGRFEVSKKTAPHIWTLPASAKLVRGDIVCLLQGASSATVIRPGYDYFEVIMIDTLLKRSFLVEELEEPRDLGPQHDLTLLWNWGLSGGGWQNNIRNSTLKDVLNQDYQGQELEDPLTKCARLYDIATILYGLRKYEQTVELLQRVKRDHKATSGADHAQTLEILEKLLVCYAKTNQKNEVDNIILQAAQIRGYGQQADLWDQLDRASPCSQSTTNWDKIKRIVHILDLRHSEFTQDQIFERVMDRDEGVKTLLLSKRTDLFRFVETVLFVLFTQAFNKLEGDARVRQLLVGRKEGATQATERIIKLITALQTGPAAIERIRLQQLIRYYNIKISKPKEAVYLWYATRDTVLTRALSQLKEEDTYVTKEIRAAAGGNPTRAVEILISSLQEPIRVTEQMLKIGAAKSNTNTMEVLLRRKGKNAPITEDVLKAASENLFEGGQIINYIAWHEMAKPEVTMKYRQIYWDNAEKSAAQLRHTAG